MTIAGSARCVSRKNTDGLMAQANSIYYKRALCVSPIKIKESTVMMSVEKLVTLLRPIIPHLPKAIQRLMPAVLASLPLAFEIAHLLHKHREKIKEIFENLAELASTQSKKETDGIAAAIPRLPRRRARWLKRRLVYLPLALEIAKASNRKNMKRFRNLTAPLPGNVKKKIGRILQRDRRPSRWNVSQRFRRSAD